ncbi:FliI/YscN family ATPase [Paraburkholderia sediminicola]|uniref:FliI/YscN family ATPase n=1 Tax=Paraburkholderia sediminicola TaxID=458836 RepID=UPI0038B8D758
MRHSDPEVICARLSALLNPIPRINAVQKLGMVTEIAPVLITANLPGVRMGEVCWVEPRGPKAEVVGVRHHTALLSPLGNTGGMRTGLPIRALSRTHTMCVGSHLVGHIVDGYGNVSLRDGKLDLAEDAEIRSLESDAPDPLSRCLISEPLYVGIRAIDAALTVGKGQRIGVFAAAGVGKSTLLGMLCDDSAADVIVLALVGERGREVKEFIEHALTKDARARTVVVVATSDRPAMERLKATYTATTIAEFFRDKGLSVLLLVDSVTRFVRASREIALAAGESQNASGFPPSVFARLAPLLERSGQGPKGSITGVYTVLVERDDQNEPVADEMRSILDGHIVLSRKLAEGNHFPSIDVCASVSRTMPLVVDQEHQRLAGKLRSLLSKYEEISLLLRLGEYRKGNDVDADEAIERYAGIEQFLKQSKNEKVPAHLMMRQLRAAVEA